MKIEQVVGNLLEKEPFCANLLLNTKRFETKDIPTAGVNITDTVNLYYNPDFFDTLTMKEATAVLKHECLHIMHNHFDRYKKITDDEYKSTRNFNIAADLAINEMLPDLPDTIKFGDKEGQTAKVKFLQKSIPTAQNNMATEYYFDLLKEDAKKNGGSGAGDGMENVDDHAIWDKSETNKEIRDHVLKEHLKKAANATKEAGREVPDCVKLLIETLSSSTVNWKKQLNNFVQNAINTKLESTRKKRNRRYGILYPGVKQEEILNLAIAVDTSGSISDRDLQQFFSEINSISKLGIDITVLEADTEVRAEYKYDPKTPINAQGRGGTLYNPAIKRAEALKVDAIIYLGDGDVFDEHVYKPKIPMLWAMTNENKAPVAWGKTIRVAVK